VVVVKVKKLGDGSPENPIRPALVFKDAEGNTHEYGKDVPGITYTVVKIEDDSVLIEVSREDLERMKNDGVQILE